MNTHAHTHTRMHARAHTHTHTVTCKQHSFHTETTLLFHKSKKKKKSIRHTTAKVSYKINTKPWPSPCRPSQCSGKWTQGRRLDSGGISSLPCDCWRSSTCSSAGESMLSATDCFRTCPARTEGENPLLKKKKKKKMLTQRCNKIFIHQNKWMKAT